jgi:hypothetical protein
MAVLVASKGRTWRVLDRVAPPHARRQWYGCGYDEQAEEGIYGLDDLNHDGLPEMVGNSQYPGWVGDVKYPGRHYVVHKVIGQRFAKVWYSKLETVPAVLMRFTEALQLDNERMARNVATSAGVVRQARALGLFDQVESWWRKWGFQEMNQAAPQPHVVTTTIYGTAYRIDLIQLSQWRWRISGISRADDDKEDTSP